LHRSVLGSSLTGNDTAPSAGARWLSTAQEPLVFFSV
jgi:hypothetical protein